MQQATEITSVALSPRRPVLGSISVMLLCSMISLVITWGAGCTGEEQNKNDLVSGRVHSDKSNASRMLRRGLTGEPRTLDPQLADDEFSFPVLRDLYEGLTAEDRNGQIVPGVAESWTVDSTGTIYTFLLRPDAKCPMEIEPSRWSSSKAYVVPLIQKQPLARPPFCQS